MAISSMAPLARWYAMSHWAKPVEVLGGDAHDGCEGTLRCIAVVGSRR